MSQKTAAALKPRGAQTEPSILLKDCWLGLGIRQAHLRRFIILALSLSLALRGAISKHV